MFAPVAHRDFYRASVSRLGIDEVLETLRDDPSVVPTPGGWAAHSVLPLDAFGRSGGYDRAKLARLYGGRRARVARGPRLENGRIVESWTLVSPYPSVSLEHLEPGTLRIVQRLPEP